MPAFQVIEALQGTNSQLRTMIGANIEVVDTLLHNGTVLLARNVLTQLDTISNRLQSSSEDGYRQLEAVGCRRRRQRRCMRSGGLGGALFPQRTCWLGAPAIIPACSLSLSESAFAYIATMLI